MNDILVAVLVLGVIAMVAAIVLYVCSKKFAVKTDPRIQQVYDMLPKANCGGCGFAGCQAMAEALVKKADAHADTPLSCPVGGADVMSQVASCLGMDAVQGEPMVAVVRCAGCTLADVVSYDGLHTCAAVNASGAGQHGCGNGCLGCGDCVSACSFGGISIDGQTGLPVVDETLCTACGSCAKACPRHVIELRPRGFKGRRVYVSCRNQDRGPVAMKLCATSCIGCGKCSKECPFGAIAIENNVAYIDYTKCKSCRKCVAACPRGAIKAVGFPVPKA